MINTNRIVPVQKTDLITLYSVILGAAGTTLTKAEPADVEGNVAIATGSSSTHHVVSAPAKSISFAGTVTADNVYFVASVNGFDGFKVGDTEITPTGAEIVADGVTLYKAVLSGGNAVAVTKYGL